MSFQHVDLAAGRWKELSFLEQMAHIGGEVERALRWQSKNHPDYSQKASERALELLDLSLDASHDFPRLKEIARTRETIVDYFFGSNQYGSNEKVLKNYFSQLAFASRKGH
jgi:hypothetical protein